MRAIQQIIEIHGTSHRTSDGLGNGPLVEQANLSFRVDLHASLVHAQRLNAHTKGNGGIHLLGQGQLASSAEADVLVRLRIQRRVEHRAVVAAGSRHHARLVAVRSSALELVLALVVAADLASKHEVAHLRITSPRQHYRHNGARSVLLGYRVHVDVRSKSAGEVLHAHGHLGDRRLHGASLRTIGQDTERQLPEHQSGAAHEAGNVQVADESAIAINGQLLRSEVLARLAVEGEFASKSRSEVLPLKSHVLQNDAARAHNYASQARRLQHRLLVKGEAVLQNIFQLRNLSGSTESSLVNIVKEDRRKHERVEYTSNVVWDTIQQYGRTAPNVLQFLQRAPRRLSSASSL